MRINIGDKKMFCECLEEIFNKQIDMESINGITFDSRRIKQNDIFIALKGSKSDGHNFMNDCLKNGASIIINEVDSNNDNILRVDSSSSFIGRLAKSYKSKMDCKVIGITGSNGKTTTKEILLHTLKTKYQVAYTKGNFNSTIGMPMSVFAIQKDDQIFIAEMGTNKKGEIAYLCDIVKPDMSLITNISEAHIGNFNSIEEIYIEKKNIFDSLDNDGIAFINVDDKFISNTSLDNGCKKIQYGFTADCHYNAKWNNDRIYINNNQVSIPYKTNSFAYNTLAAFSIASELEIKLPFFQKSIENFDIPNGRGKIIEKSNYRIIDDSYNANFTSMVTGINSIKNICTDKNRKIIVLGDMLELGDKEIIFHKKLLDVIDANKIKDIFLIGDLMENLYQIAFKKKSYNVFHYNEHQTLINSLNSYVSDNDIIYIKGSRGIKMDKIVEGLK